MLTLPAGVKVFVASQPVDARKGFDGLAAMVQSDFGLEPLSGHLFIFVNRRRYLCQMLFWDHNGFCIVKKRLEAGTFRLCTAAEGETHVEIDAAKLALMLEGVALAPPERSGPVAPPRLRGCSPSQAKE